MKQKSHLAPGTIRHRHGSLARCFDWMLREHSEIVAQNPLRLLKRGFATYTETDAGMLAKRGLKPRIDEERDAGFCSTKSAVSASNCRERRTNY